MSAPGEPVENEKPYTLRYAEWDGYEGRQLDELVGFGHIHTEDLGGAIMLMLYDRDYAWRVHLTITMQRKPRSHWWDEIRDAWYSRRLPCFWEPRQVLIEEESRA